jgi:hypothetical protein
MSNASTIESRVEALERELAEVKRRLNGGQQSGSWLERVSGSQSQNAEFDEVLKLGREARSAERPSDGTAT